MTAQQLMFGNVAYVHATWNPADKHANITLSSGNLVATFPGGTLSVRATRGKSAGKWYWEVVINTWTGYESIGIADSGMPLNTYAGNTANSYSYNPLSGAKYNNGGFTSYGAAFVAGDVIGVALDMDAKTLSFYKNGASQGVAFSSLPSITLYPAISNVFSTSVMTTNFGATPFAYTPPAGHGVL